MDVIRVTEADVFLLAIRIEFDPGSGNIHLLQQEEQVFELFTRLDGESDMVKSDVVLVKVVIRKRLMRRKLESQQKSPA